LDDKNFDEKTAKDWISAVESPGISWRDKSLYPKLNKLIQNKQSIIDIGCGQGIVSEKLNLKNSSYTGVEPSTYLLDRGKELYESRSIKFLKGSAYSIPCEDNSFDCAISILVWHLLKDIKKASWELSRILNEGGEFIITTANPNSYKDWEAMYSNIQKTGKRFTGTMKIRHFESQDVLYFHSFVEIKEALEKAGLRIETIVPLLKKDDNNLLIIIKGIKRT